MRCFRRIHGLMDFRRFIAHYVWLNILHIIPCDCCAGIIHFANRDIFRRIALSHDGGIHCGACRLIHRFRLCPGHVRQYFTAHAFRLQCVLCVIIRSDLNDSSVKITLRHGFFTVPLNIKPSRRRKKIHPAGIVIVHIIRRRLFTFTARNNIHQWS